MTDDYAQQKQLAMQWKRAAPHLAAARRNDIRRQNKTIALHALDGLFQMAMTKRRPAGESGLVEMYKILKRSKG